VAQPSTILHGAVTEESMTRTRLGTWLLVCAAVLVPQPTLIGQGASRTLDKETFMEMEGVTSPAISPDGRLVVFTREWIDQMKDQTRSNLWIADVTGGRVRELTRGAWRDSAPVWAPDSKRLAFLSDRDGTSQVNVMYVDSGEIAQLTHLERAASGLAWSPDGSQLAFTQTLPDETPVLSVQLPKRPRGAEWAKPAVLVDRLTWEGDGSGLIEKGYRHVFVVDGILGGTPRQVTTGAFNHGPAKWAADGRTLYTSGLRVADAEYLIDESEIYAIDLRSGAITPLTSRKGADSNPLPSPDGRWIAYTGYDEKRYTNHIANLYLMDGAGGGKRTLVDAQMSSPGDLTWAADSSGLYYTMEERGSTAIYFAPVTGAPKKMTEGLHTLTSLSVSSSGQIATVRSTSSRPGYLVTFPAAAGRDPGKWTTLADVNADVMANRKLGEVEEMWFSSKDGLKVQGWLVKPVDFQPGKKYPLVLWIHGGPWSMYKVGFDWAFQNLAASGYAVLYTNPRGSTGYGQEFVNGIQYSYPGKDYDDLMAGVDAALAKGYIDQNNLFICGGSGGGLLTAWAVGQTTRFAAAVAMRPVIDWQSFVGNTDNPSWYSQFRKYPWEDPMEFAARSPLTHVANVSTPTMVMTGEADLRTPIRQSEEFYRALKMLKKETVLVRMPDEFHGWRRPSHRLLQQLYLQAWFDKHKRAPAAATQQ
jgi:dipeptidyl aminopeptidase/acylaminoacyl peptidase